MRILYLNQSSGLGGTETCLLELARALVRLRPDWELHTLLGEEGPLIPRLQAAGVRTVVVPMPPALAQTGDSAVRFNKGVGRWFETVRILTRAALSRPAYLNALRAAIKDIQPDIVHAMSLKMHLLGADARPFECPLIWHVHDDIVSRPLSRRLWQRDLHKCDAVLANSRFIGSSLEPLCRAQGKILTSVHNAVDTSMFRPSGSKAMLSAGSSGTSERLRIGLPATFARWKGQETFIEAIRLLPRDLNVEAFIIGGPIYRTNGSQYTEPELSKFAAERGVRVTFSGFRDDMPAVLRALDIVVHASTKPEPFGMVLIEAMACGRAVIASRAGGALEIVTEGVDGVMHEPGDAAHLAECITRLARNPELRKQLGSAARRTVQERFSSRAFAANMSSIYERLAGSETSSKVA
jgi:glycosyltransferase involved in cell wall biosynthesis